MGKQNAAVSTRLSGAAGFVPAQAARYKEHSTLERAFRLRNDEFGNCHVRWHAKVTYHLMFGCACAYRRSTAADAVLNPAINSRSARLSAEQESSESSVRTAESLAESTTAKPHWGPMAYSPARKRRKCANLSRNPGQLHQCMPLGPLLPPNAMDGFARGSRKQKYTEAEVQGEF